MKAKLTQLRFTFRDRRVARFLKNFPAWQRGLIVENALAYCLANPKSGAFDMVFKGMGVFKPLATPTVFTRRTGTAKTGQPPEAMSAAAVESVPARGAWTGAKTPSADSGEAPVDDGDPDCIDAFTQQKKGGAADGGQSRL